MLSSVSAFSKALFSAEPDKESIFAIATEARIPIKTITTIISTNVSGIPEQVKDGYNGFLVEPKDSNMLTEKITCLLNNEDEMIKMGKNSRKRIIEKDWTWEGYARKVKKVYDSVAEKT